MVLRITSPNKKFRSNWNYPKDTKKKGLNCNIYAEIKSKLQVSIYFVKRSLSLGAEYTKTKKTIQFGYLL